MNNLPQELIDEICSYLPWDHGHWNFDDLKNTLTVSRRFQIATERASCQFKKFILTSSNSKEFLKIYNTHRRYFLQDIEFQTSAPPLPRTEELKDDDDLAPCRDTLEDLAAIDKSFSDQIHLLFTVLKTMEDRVYKEDPLGNITLAICTPTRTVDTNRYCLHRKYVSWRVHLLSPESLPKLSSITSLNVLQNGDGQCVEEAAITPAKLDLRVLLDLAVKLPNLEYLGCKLVNDDWTTDIPSAAIKHYTRDWEGPRRDTRHDFAKALQELGSKLPISLKEAQLSFVDQLKLSDSIDQRQLLPDLIKPAMYDPFSSSLRLFSSQLRKLKLQAVVDKTLFWPSKDEAPVWPNLENLDVMFHMATPKGYWYFKGVNGDDQMVHDGFEVTAASYPPLGPVERERDWDIRADWDDDMDWSTPESLQFRVVPDNDVLVPFLAGFAKAATNMPLLKKAALWSPLKFYPTDVSLFYQEYNGVEFVSDYEAKLAWGIVYAAPGEKAFHALENQGEMSRLESTISGSRRIWWKVGKWRPDPDLHQLFKQISRQDNGEILFEYWEDDVYGKSLVGREIFDYKLAIF
jgi:hypothetical protein